MFQKVTLMGRVGQAPEMRFTPQGTPVANFSLATTQLSPKKEGQSCPEGWKDSYNGKNWELTTWWRVTAWGALAEFVNTYIGPKAILLVEGEINGMAVDGSQYPRIWKTRDGESRSSFEITARTIKPATWGDKDTESSTPTQTQADEGGWTPDYDW